MAVPSRPDPDTSPGLFTSLRSFWLVVVSIVHTRLDLVTMELEEEATRAVKLVLVSFAAVLCAIISVFFAMFLLLAAVWNTVYRLPVLGGIFAIYVIGAIVLGLVARQMLLHRPKFLSQTLAELKKDVEHIQPIVQSLESKP